MSLNICSTALAAEFSSFAPEGAAPAAGSIPPESLERSPMVSDLLHSQSDNACRNVARNPDFADLDRQHEVNGATHGLLVGGKAAKDLFRRAFDQRQGPVGFHGFGDPPRG